MRTYPDILQPPTWPDYVMTPRNMVNRMSMEVGDDRSRRFSAAKRWDTELTFRQTDSEAALFWAWFWGDAWALSGDSDSLAGFTQNNLSSLTYPVLGPDGQAAARMVENTTATAIHAVTLSLPAAPQNATIELDTTFRAGTRPCGRIGFQNWAGTLCYTTFDFSTQAWAGGANFLSRSFKDRGNGWYRITMTCAASSGVSTPFFRMNMGLTGGGVTYTGDGASYIDLCEQQCRVVTNGLTGFLRTGSDNMILGADAGNAWVQMSVPLGGGLQTKEVQLVSPSARPLNSGVNWKTSMKAMVR